MSRPFQTVRAPRRLAAACAVAGLLATACSSAGDEAASAAADSSPATTEVESTTTTAAEPTTTTTTMAPTETDEPEAEEGANEGEGYDTTDLGNGWIEVAGGEDCQCSDGSDWNFYVQLGASEGRQVMVLFEGGGACWNDLTCGPALGTYKATVSDGRPNYDPLDLDRIGGVFDNDNAENPLADYTKVFVPYCTGDVHLGNREVAYLDGDLVIQHRGSVNANTAVDFVVDTYGAVEDLFVTGMSAGSIPTPLYAGVFADRLPEARVSALADASGAYPDVPDLNADLGGTWGALDAAPDWEQFDGLAPSDFSLPGLIVAVQNRHPDLQIGRFDNAYDGVQVTFLNLSGVREDLSGLLDANEAQIEAASRELPVYKAPGTDHTILMGNGVYEEEVDGVRFVDWLSGLVTGEPVTDVKCSDCEG